MMRMVRVGVDLGKIMERRCRPEKLGKNSGVMEPVL
jgi:hypothetical protein